MRQGVWLTMWELSWALQTPVAAFLIRRLPTLPLQLVIFSSSAIMVLR